MPNFGYTLQAIKPKGRMVYEYNPLYNYRLQSEHGLINDMITTGDSQLNFDLEHPVDIICQKSYDGSVNLILNDNKNQPRLINTRFTALENNTYERVDRTGNTDTNLYDDNEFEIDTSLLKKYINIPKVNFQGVFYGGNLPVGNYTFYFKLADGDDNETDIVAESGIVTIHMGSIDDPQSIRGGQFNEDSGKSVQFILTNVDSGYDYLKVYYTRTVGADNNERSVQAVKILNRFRIRQGACTINITGNESFEQIPVESISQDFFMASAAKTQAQCQNMLFLGNVKKFTPDYETLSKLSLNFLPYYKVESEQVALGSVLDESYTSGGYYNVKNIYNKVGYWNEEIYRFGVVYIMANGSLSPVYNIRGINGVPKLGSNFNYSTLDNSSINYDTQLINNTNLENSAGVCRIVDNTAYSFQQGGYFQVRSFVFKPYGTLIQDLKDLNIKGYFFVRQKRIPTILCQAFMIGKEQYSGIPAWYLKNGDSENDPGIWTTETFLNSQGYLTHDYGERLLNLRKENVKTSVGICPEFELNQPYYNNLFTGSYLRIKQVTDNEKSLGGEDHHVYINTSGIYNIKQSGLQRAKIVSVPDSGLIRDNGEIFRNIAGSPNENTFQYLVNKTNKPKKSNFEHTRAVWTFINGFPYYSGTETVASKVKIVRGLYSPYIGIYKNNSLTPNSLINIYIPGYDVSQMPEYYKMRINNEDAYFAVSDRKSINELTSNGENVYRGDCFISQFTHRINRNFQDPDAPCNENIVDTDTWREKYDEDTDATDEINRGDLNAVRMGTYITVKCYTSYNIAMRDWDGSYPGEEALTGNKRSFYPLSGLRIDGHSKIPQSCAYNQAFSATLGEKLNFLQPAVPYIKNVFQTRVIYSDIAQTDAFKNGYRIFRGHQYVDYSNQYGGITKLVEWKGNLIIIFEHAIALAAVNEKALIPTDDGTQIALGAIKPLATTPIMISTDFGTQWPESVCKTDLYIYGVDTVGKKIWRTDGHTIDFISDFKVQKFLNENITLTEKELTPIIGVRNVKTHYNAYKHDVMFTYYDNTYGFEEKVWSLCWNEYQGAQGNGFTTFYSWIPSYSANIDNIFFSYDRNASKWIAKLGQSTSISSNASGVCMVNPLIENSSLSQQLYLKNRAVPEGRLDTDYFLTFELERDNFGFYNYFKIDGSNPVTVGSTQINSVYTLKIKGNTQSERNVNYTKLLKYWFTIDGVAKDPIVPCIQLNIKCSIQNIANNSDPNGWETYQLDNAGYYESQVFLTLKSIYENTSRTRTNQGRWQEVQRTTISVDSIPVSLPTFETAFWKHGQAGIIDIKDRIKPCFWYGKQHPFEFEYVTGNDNAGYKQFDNLTISSNNVAPESIHYTIIGDSYDFSMQKPAMYFRQEATKAFYQYNGSNILYDHTVFDKNLGYLPEKITSNDYIERDQAGNPLRHQSAVSTTYKDTLMPWLYVRQDTFNEVEDYYKKVVATPTYADYPNLTGGEIQWDQTLDQFSICNHVKCRDIKEVGRVRGNIQYVNDKWTIQISPLNVINRNNTWVGDLPKLVINNIPEEIFEHHPNGEGVAFPPELTNTTSDYLMGVQNKTYTPQLLDFTPWNDIANSRREVKLLDKVLKTRIRYKGDKLAIILATATSFNTIA